MQHKICCATKQSKIAYAFFNNNISIKSLCYLQSNWKIKLALQSSIYISWYYDTVV